MELRPAAPCTHLRSLVPDAGWSPAVCFQDALQPTGDGSQALLASPDLLRVRNCPVSKVPHTERVLSLINRSL